MTTTLFAIAIAIQGQASPAQVQEWYEAGDDQQVIQAAETQDEPRVIYLAGLAHVRLEQLSQARDLFDRLSQGEENVWTHIGRSAIALNGPATDASAAEAEAAALQAIGIDSRLAIAHYQLGLARGRQDDFEGAASAFETAVGLDPKFAYAHYYGGLASYQNRQTTKMAVAFEKFLRVAPSAPERGQVESTMRTLRGR